MGTDCGDFGADRFKGVCDKNGCDIQHTRFMGKGQTFYGPGSKYKIDTTKPVTVTTQFITADGTDTGKLMGVKQFYTQNGRTIEHPKYSLNANQHNSITDKIEGADKEYTGTYGVTTKADKISLQFVTEGPYTTNVGSRLYMMDNDDTNYKMFHMKHREFTFTVDDADIDCGLNGAMYFVQMDNDGGKSKYSKYSDMAGAILSASSYPTGMLKVGVAVESDLFNSFFSRPHTG